MNLEQLLEQVASDLIDKDVESAEEYLGYAQEILELNTCESCGHVSTRWEYLVGDGGAHDTQEGEAEWL